MAFAKKTSGAKKSAPAKEYDDANRGVLFMNDKDGNDARPDMTGNAKIKVADFEVDGDGLISVRLAAWQKESEKVGTYLSVSISAPKQD